jgi:hypothetical protein
MYTEMVFFVLVTGHMQAVCSIRHLHNDTTALFLTWLIWSLLLPRWFPRLPHFGSFVSGASCASGAPTSQLGAPAALLLPIAGYKNTNLESTSMV